MLIGRVPAPGRRRRVCGLLGSSEALAAAEVAAEFPHVVFVTRDVASATHLAEEIGFFGPSLRVALFPDWEVLSYERFSPPADLVAERLRVLAGLRDGAPGVTVVAAHTLMLPVPPPEYVAGRAFVLRVGDRVGLDEFVGRLARSGYCRVDRVADAGEFAVHGGQLDVFPPGAPRPIRIVLDDETVDELRFFDPETQRSVARHDTIEVLPAREYPSDPEGRAAFCAGFLGHGDGFTADAEVYRAVREGRPCGGIEFYLPLFFGAKHMFLDHVPADSVVLLHREVREQLEGGLADARARHESVVRYEDRPALAPSELFHDAGSLYARLGRLRCVEICPPGTPSAARCPVSAPPDLALRSRSRDPFAPLREFLGGHDGRVLVTVASEGRRDMMRENLGDAGIGPVPDYPAFAARSGPRIADAVAPLREGFALDLGRIVCVTEREIYGMQAPPPARRRPVSASHPSLPLLAVEDMREGDLVVHVSHGIGRYAGLTTEAGSGHEEEFIVLEYAGGARLMVPLGQLHLVGRHIGAASGDEVALDRLGSGRWEKTKEKARRKASDVAAQLIEAHARRALKKGFAHRIPADYPAFAARFGFTETADQRVAINDVLADLQMPRPMDRLVCGDVGFGKTEVALRAAFVVASGGRQVAVLAPTTILASQHFQVFSDRFSGFPVSVGEFSRLRSGSENAAAAAQVEAGKIAIAVGTHNLLQPGFRFRDLGLLVIDEEHRFGVRQKERLRALRGDVDVLTMTATPIPRTLAMALEGISEFSTIATAPEGRCKVLTFVSDHRRELVVDAVRREVMRGGQVFYVHNDIRTMEETLDRLRSWMPDVRMEHAHGKMPKTRLERVVRRFYRHEFDVLLTTTIIEIGVDIPNANTILVERADRFGLAQLHQLRGRVGRSHHQAYAYLLTEPGIREDSSAHARMLAIRDADGLGGGYGLAVRDLEIRGSGNVLGEEQSGQIEAVGYTMYRQMLASAVRALRAEADGGAAPADAEPVEVEVDESCLLPAGYCPSVNERLRLYRRMSAAAEPKALEALADEIADRFGPAPPPAELLFDTHRFRLRVAGAGIRRVKLGRGTALIDFAADAPCAERVIDLAKSGAVRLTGQSRISVPCVSREARAALAEVANFVEGLRGAKSRERPGELVEAGGAG